MHKIKSVSSFFRFLFQAIFIIYPILLVLFWINAPKSLSPGQHALGIEISFLPDMIINAEWYKSIHMLTATNKLLGFLISLIPLAITEFTLYFLIQLFGLYKQAEIFSLKNVNYIKKIGYTLLIGQLLDPFYQALMTVNLTWHLHPKILAIGFSGTNIGIILMALLVILISWIMAEGVKLREEQQLTI